MAAVGLGEVFTSALEWFVQYLLKGIALKMLTFTIIYFILTMLFPILISFLPEWFSTGTIRNAFQNIPNGIWYFLDLFSLNEGLNFILTAYVARFVIRRIPFIG